MPMFLSRRAAAGGRRFRRNTVAQPIRRQGVAVPGLESQLPAGQWSWSRHWQRDCASELVAAHGMIVAEYFDVGCSRRRGWRQRPQAAALLAALKDPDRGFDAIVVGEYERAFSANQLQHLAPVLDHHGVQLWLPETDGPVDHHDPPTKR
ncbi:hypothetical protein [Micromonospora sp. AMSO12t]|uniref:hypothetical protein n=1 Tax=Micromonospora sp. AMSO12t TaxID=2650410 RepID=UPI001CEE03AF|nr:hypothetical protein [Micromonospora sp. AMSO12t]